MSVRDEFQRMGVGTALLQAAVDLADKWGQPFAARTGGLFRSRTSRSAVQEVWLCH
jgi:GNAT superfamily N-acetyltransferase